VRQNPDSAKIFRRGRLDALLSWQKLIRTNQADTAQRSSSLPAILFVTHGDSPPSRVFGGNFASWQLRRDDEMSGVSTEMKRKTGIQFRAAH